MKVNTNNKIKSSAGAARTAFVVGCAALTGLNKCTVTNNPGLAPWALQEYRPVGAHCPTATIPPIDKQYNHNQTKHERTQQSIYTPPKHTSQSDKEPCKGDTPT